MNNQSIWILTYIRVAFDTENLLEECGETGEDANTRAETHQQDHVGFICQQLQGKQGGEKKMSTFTKIAVASNLHQYYWQPLQR